MNRADEIVNAYLADAANMDHNIALFHQLSSDLRGEHLAATRTRLYATVQDYLLAQRKLVLDAMELTPEKILEINPPQETMKKLNAICAFHGVDRVMIHLYLFIYLESVVGGDVDILMDTDRMVEKLFTS